VGIAEETGISTGSRHDILTEDLTMHQVSAKFVPRLLIDDQRTHYVSICKVFLQQVNDNENLLKNIITRMRLQFIGMILKQNNSHHYGRVLIHHTSKPTITAPEGENNADCFFDYWNIAHHGFAQQTRWLSKLIIWKF
jgi:hypothetical protein